MRQGGMTLVEVLVAMVIASLIGMFIVNMFITSNRTYMDQNKILDVQRSGRISMEAMVKLLREAGLDPLKSASSGFSLASAGRVRFTRDVNMNGAIDASNAETVEFELAGNMLRRRYDGGSWIDMADNVSRFLLKYYDESGNPMAFDIAGNPLGNDASGNPIDITIGEIPASERSKIRSIVLTIDFQDTKYSGGDFVRNYTTSLNCRNL